MFKGGPEGAEHINKAILHTYVHTLESFITFKYD